MLIITVHIKYRIVTPWFRLNITQPGRIRTIFQNPSDESTETLSMDELLHLAATIIQTIQAAVASTADAERSKAMVFNKMSAKNKSYTVRLARELVNIPSCYEATLPSTSQAKNHRLSSLSSSHASINRPLGCHLHGLTGWGGVYRWGLSFCKCLK